MLPTVRGNIWNIRREENIISGYSPLLCVVSIQVVGEHGAPEHPIPCNACLLAIVLSSVQLYIRRSWSDIWRAASNWQFSLRNVPCLTSFYFVCTINFSCSCLGLVLRLRDQNSHTKTESEHEPMNSIFSVVNNQITMLSVLPDDLTNWHFFLGLLFA